MRQDLVFWGGLWEARSASSGAIDLTSVKNYDIKTGTLFGTSSPNFYKKLMRQLWYHMAEWSIEGSMGRNEGGLGRWVRAGIKWMDERMPVRMHERPAERTDELTYDYLHAWFTVFGSWRPSWSRSRCFLSRHFWGNQIEMPAYNVSTYIINFLLYGPTFKHRFFIAQLVHLDINHTSTLTHLGLSQHLHQEMERNISNMGDSVSSDIQTPRGELKRRSAAEYFWRNSRCLDSR